MGLRPGAQGRSGGRPGGADQREQGAGLLEVCELERWADFVHLCQPVLKDNQKTRYRNVGPAGGVLFSPKLT